MENDRKQFAVLGLGRFGFGILETLYKQGYEVLVADVDGNKVELASKMSTLAMQIDFRDEHSMNDLGLNNYDVVIVAIGEDLETCIMASIFAKEKGAYVIAKANNNMQKIVLEKMGVDRVVLPEKEMGERLATNLVTTNVIDFINLSESFGIAEILPLQEWVGKNLIESNIRATHKVNIVAIKKNDQKIIVTPAATHKIEEGDRLVVIADSTVISQLS
ncbi:MAG: potassium channel family protein [Lachnospirales bacterium]